MKNIKNFQYQFFNVSIRIYFGNTEKKTQNCTNVSRKQQDNGASTIFHFQFRKYFMKITFLFQ